MSGKARVVHILTTLDAGGAEGSAAKLIAGSQDRYQATVIGLMGWGPTADRLAAAGVPVYTLGLRRGQVKRASTLRLVRLLGALAPDLVHGWMYHGNLAAWVARRWGCPGTPLLWSVVHTPAALRLQKTLTAAVILLGARLSRSVDGIVYNSRASMARHQQIGYRPGRSRWIPNGYEVARHQPPPDARERVRSELAIAPQSVVVGLVARYHPVKDHDTFLSAAAEVARRRRDVVFLLAGRGTDTAAKLRTSIDRLGIADRTHLLGERRDVPDLFSAMDIACLSSRAEGFPNVVAEAMAVGVPCVVTDVGEAAHLVGSTGTAVPAGQASAMANAILGLIVAGEEERHHRGAAARARIAEHFGIDRMLVAYDALYLELLEERSRTLSR